MRLGCTTGRSPVLLDDSCSSLMANLWESAGFFSSSVSVSVTESQPESKIKYTQSCCNTPLCWKCLSHTSILKNSYEGCGVELAIPPKVMLRKGDLVEERETTEFPLFFFFSLKGIWGGNSEGHKRSRVPLNMLTLQTTVALFAELDSPLVLDRRSSVWMSNIRMISIWTHLT